MKPASSPPAAPHSDLLQGDDATERSEIRFGLGDPFGPLDSDDIEWIQQHEAKRAARETRRCTHCGTAFHPVSPYAEDCPSLGRHEERCRDASASERTFYRSHRRWPRPGQVDGTTEEAA
jgi:hypothetical protein